MTEKKEKKKKFKRKYIIDKGKNGTRMFLLKSLC